LDILLDSFLIGPTEGYSTPWTAVIAARERPLEGIRMRQKVIAHLTEYYFQRERLTISYETVIKKYNWNDCVRGTSFPPLAPILLSTEFIAVESFTGTLSGEMDRRLHQEVSPTFTSLKSQLD
jgi:hypothetical protein